MPVFQYRAVDANGAVIEGSLDAKSEGAVETQLRQSGAELLRCAERGRGIFGRKAKISRKELIGFCFHMQQMT
ncbi:MAG: hypothetical protein AAFN50_14990, partial [Pseudomonadota bacterium]